MKVFVGIFACLVAVQAQPLFGLDSLTGGGGSDPTSALTSVLGSGSDPTSAVSGLSGGLPVPGLPDLSSIFSKTFSGSDGAAAFPPFLTAFQTALGKANPNGDIPIDTFKSTFNDAAKKHSGFPFNIVTNILDNFSQIFGSNGIIPGSVTSKFSDLLSQGNITPEQFTSTLKSCPLASGLNAKQSNSDSHSDDLDYKHNENTSLSKRSADESNDSSSLSLN